MLKLVKWILKSLAEMLLRLAGSEQNSQPPAGLPHPAPFPPIRVRTSFGKDREVRMIELRGPHVFCETCDPPAAGPKQIVLVHRGQVYPESVAEFDQFMGRI